MRSLKKICLLFLTAFVVLGFTACGEKAVIDKEDQYRRIVFNLIAKQLDSRDFEILEIIPLNKSSNLIAVNIKTTDEKDFKRLYKADTNLIETKLTGEYLWQSENLMGISLNIEIIDNNTVIYGDINNDHMSSYDKMLVPIDLASVEIKLANSPNFVKAKLYKGFYFAVAKNKSDELQEIFFVNKNENSEINTTFTYSDEYEYMKALEPDTEPSEEPLYMKYEEGSNEWYIAKYISPLVFTGILIDENWSDTKDLDPSYFTALFFTLRQVNKTLSYDRFYDETTDKYTIPASFLEDIIAEYFNVKPEHLRKSSDYDKTSDSYILSEYNVTGEYLMSVADIVKHEDNTFTIYVNAYNQEPLTEENLSCIYSFRIETVSGSSKYKYLSYTYEKPIDEIPFEDLNVVE